MILLVCHSKCPAAVRSKLPAKQANVRTSRNRERLTSEPPQVKVVCSTNGAAECLRRKNTDNYYAPVLPQHFLGQANVSNPSGAAAVRSWHMH